MIFKTNDSRGAKIPTETCAVSPLTLVLSTITLCIFSIAPQFAVARGLRPLIYQSQDANVAAMTARLGDADAKGQALKFEATDLMNIEAQFFSARQSSTAAATGG